MNTTKHAKAYAAGKRYAVIAAYAFADRARNDVLSTHATYQLAARAVRRQPKGFAGIVTLADYI